MKWDLVDDYDALSDRAARLLLSALRENPGIVLGLPTGHTPEGMYARVVSECVRGGHCFREARTFNLDEYVGIPREHPGSYCSYMKHHLFDSVDVDPHNIHVPDGSVSDLEQECVRYEEQLARAGGLDLTFLGLGRNGHIGFNEPGTPFDSRTRVVNLAESTRIANAANFGDGEVPTRAITMGIGTILSSKQIALLASGEGKREAVARLRAGNISEDLPASALWRHANVTVIVDRAADGTTL
jgi:glucosamine-6-phosphate deaminase